LTTFTLTPEQWKASALVDEVWEKMSNGNYQDLIELKQALPSFPHGVDPFYERQWLTNAIDAQALAAVEWMIGENVNLSYRDDEGYTPLMSAIELSTSGPKYQILESLLNAGAAPDQVGLYGTAAHLAAMRGDLNALKILLKFGANICLPFEDLGRWSTPLDEANRQNKTEVAAFLQYVCSRRRK
jgi:hypothetical protein